MWCSFYSFAGFSALVFPLFFVPQQPQRTLLIKCVNGARLIKGFNPDVRNSGPSSSSGRVLVRRGKNKRRRSLFATDCRARRSLKSISNEKSPSYCLTQLRERTRKCILHSWDRTFSSIGKRASRISYFTEGSAVFRGKCTVSILSLSPEDPRRLKIYIA